MKLRLSVLALCALALGGCPAASNEPPPPVRKPEIPTAPPHALGALAAGTDAAPKPDVTLPEGEAEPDAPGTPVPAPVAPGPAPDDSAETPDPPAPAPHAAPDAGMAL
ncbi:MAG: hypothetical protein ABUL60_28500 [Myxococcales bacterium]